MSPLIIIIISFSFHLSCLFISAAFVGANIFSRANGFVLSCIKLISICCYNIVLCPASISCKLISKTRFTRHIGYRNRLVMPQVPTDEHHRNESYYLWVHRRAYEWIDMRVAYLARNSYDALLQSTAYICVLLFADFYKIHFQIPDCPRCTLSHCIAKTFFIHPSIHSAFISRMETFSISPSRETSANSLWDWFGIFMGNIVVL